MANKNEDSHHPRDSLQLPPSSQLRGLIASIGEGRDANDLRALLPDLRAQLLALETQGRELHDTRRALEISRDRHARLYDLAPVGYATLDPHGCIRGINPAGARILGRPASALVNSPFANFLERGDRHIFLTHIAQVVDGEPSAAAREIRVRLLTGGGPRVLRLISFRQEGDQGPECLSALLDVTTEETLHDQRESDLLRQAVLDALPAEVVVLDRRGIIIAVNEAWRRFASENDGSENLRAGVGLDYVAACRGIQGEGAEQANLIVEGMEAVIQGRSSHFSHEYPCHTAVRQRWFALTAAPVDREPAAAVVVHSEITERRLAGERARRASDAMARAARVNAVGTLAVSLLHALAQPLSAASFYSGSAVTLLAQDASQDDRLSKILLGVDQQIERAAGILERLRGFLRRREVKKSEIPIDEIISRAMGLVDWFAADRHVRLDFERPAPGALVNADSLQIEQVLVNLICNSVQAIDTADSAHREVSISVDRRAGEIEVAVRDAGPGVPADMQERLFDIFASSQGAGLGMGLSVSREIVEAHDGKLWADSEVTDGAVFRFTLPSPQSGGTG
jgi:signal transduction histidine kinase